MEKPFLSLIAQLNTAGVEYVVIGGHAVNAYGFMRFTDDLDVLIHPTPANAARAVRAMEALGYTEGEFEEDDFLRIPSFLTFGFQGEWMDLLTQARGVTFEECWDGATVVLYEDVEIRFMSLRALRQAKTATGRPLDLADLDNLPLVPQEHLPT